MTLLKFNQDLFNAKTVDETRKLIESGADVNAQDSYGWTAMMYYTKNGTVGEDQMKLLIEAGADVGIVNTCGWTALRMAKTDGQRNLIREAIEAERSVSESASETASETASDSSNVQVVRVPTGTKVQIEYY